MNTSRHANRLINEKSPYLLQHANNPVDWYPWNEEAFEVAISKNMPIFLSIGYSTCHWCHVMEKESFEDKEVSVVLNRYFVPIKVDREERPDVDHLYMAFCQALTGAGGWPLTILMTPEKKPFFAGTYFPKTNRYGRQGLIELLEQVGALWTNKEEKLRSSAEEIVTAVQSQRITTNKNMSNVPLKTYDVLDQSDVTSGNDSLEEWGNTAIEQAYKTLSESFDNCYGGFGHSPKFPTPHTLTFLLRYALDHPEKTAHEMVQKTLDGMARGGIYDHIGFGFARYSTDDKWLVPHFEKMLYDNALLAFSYLENYQVGQLQRDAQKAKEIFSYILRDMTSAEGGFYSAEDADAEGIEGKFHVWTPEEIETALGKENALNYCAVYDISEKGNFEGKNIPNLLQGSLSKLALDLQVSEDTVLSSLEQDRLTLFTVRENRIHPYKDDKILTAWNGLMIASLSKGAQVLGDASYLNASERATEFILTQLQREDGRLMARYREGEAAFPGYLDDYAFFIWGLLELYTASGKPNYLKNALRFQLEQERLFCDEDNGGYFLTGKDAEELIFRPKESYDGALPSGNSISALNLIRIARLTGDVEWERKAELQLHSFRTVIEEHPSGHTAFIQALQSFLHPTHELILSGSLESLELQTMRQIFHSGFRPYSTILHQEGTLSKIISWTKDYPIVSGKVSAYLCQDFSCNQPVNSPEELKLLLANS